MPRCPSCNKYAALDTDESPEVNLNVDEGKLVGTIKIENKCAECSTLLKSFTFDIEEEGDFDHECPTKEAWEADKENNEEPAWDISGWDFERTMVQRPPKGKVKATFYGFEGVVTLTCSCSHDVEVTIKDEVQAKNMDDEL